MADDKAEASTQEVVEVPIVEESPADAVVVLKNEPKPTECPNKNIIPGKFFQVKRISGLLSVVSFVFSLPVLSSVIWLLYMKSYDCESLFKLPKLQIGISIGLICVFFVCNAALCLKNRLKMVGIVLVMVPLTAMFTIDLAFLGADSMENRRIPATPLWFEMKTHDDKLWSNIKGPPAECELQQVNATSWAKKDKTETDPDCDVWKNSIDGLCYDCLACRQGYMKALQSKWLKLGVFLVCMSLLLISSHLSLFLVTMWEIHIS
ncbi:Cytochrome c oxidase subunit 6b [Hibiscus syriacus]|uniref:Cytochrome c oxidase subunit 6b n=1 Tax=Hibiscus syriacus TaxID=106335 RepID=A0A6A2ZJ41_HIBSY|nr:Cytochrome c oxidase subunit 6b [Hibiscus syriacus]